MTFEQNQENIQPIDFSVEKPDIFAALSNLSNKSEKTVENRESDIRFTLGLEQKLEDEKFQVGLLEVFNKNLAV